MTATQAHDLVLGFISGALEMWLAVERAKGRDADFRLTFMPFEVRIAEEAP